MHLYEVTFLPKKGVEAPEQVVTVPLLRGEPNSVLRALRPNFRIAKIAPVGVPIRDYGQYTYWTLSFEYLEGPYVGNLGDDEMSSAASKACSEAERMVDYVLTLLKVEHVHQYSWPNGSLYFTVRIDGDNIVDLVNKIDTELEFLKKNPVTVRWSYAQDKKRKYRRIAFGKRTVRVEKTYPIPNPWETDPMKLDCLNYVEYFERDRNWRKKTDENFSDPLHQAFRSGMTEAFGHQRLYHYSVRPSELSYQKEPASEEECTAYVGGYALGKVLLALTLPANRGLGQKPWRFLKDENEESEVSNQ